MSLSAAASARAVADAVLYEGYVLYPYRANSSKNQVRWQWGVVMPADVGAADPSERSQVTTQVLVDGGGGSLVATLRFLHVQQRRVERAEQGRFVPVPRLEVDGAAYLTWEEATPVERDIEVPADGCSVVLDIDGDTDVEELADASGAVVGRIVRTREPLRVGLQVAVARPESPYAVRVLTIAVDNRTPPAATEDATPGPARPLWLRRALVATHLLLRVEDARFLSLTDPPQWASALAESCRHDGLFPVLGAPGSDDSVVLAAPIILYDHPELAPESASAFFDALEVDELLSLRVATLSDAERREVRATDPRAAALLDEVDAMPAELWARLHGAVRQPEQLPWWDPGVDAAVDPDSDTVLIGDTAVGRGSRVILRPGVRRADAYDLFLAGRTATVAAVLFDVDHGTHLAVTVDDDPGSDLKDSHGRYLYFAPDEVEPLAAGVVR